MIVCENSIMNGCSYVEGIIIDLFVVIEMT